MSRNPMQEMDEQLLAKYLSGEALPEEAIRVETWLQEDTANISLFHQACQIWNQLSKVIPHQLPDQKVQLHQFKAALNERKKGIRMGQRKKYLKMGMAASLLLCGLLTTWFLFFHHSGQSLSNITEMITRNTDDHTLIDDLPDSSRVLLNNHSSIIYPTSFASDTRLLQLKGEAWFRIHPRPDWPFEIRVGPVTVKVLGTTFNLRQQSDSVLLSLQSGSVRMVAAQDSILLQSGQQGIYDIPNKRFTIVSHFDPNLHGYATRVFNFQNASLSQIVATIGNAYNTKIIIENQEIAHCTISSSFEDQSLEYILRVISATLNIQYRIENKTVYLSGKSCE